MRPADRYWLAGYLEGEGSFLAPPPSARPSAVGISAVSTDEDVVARVGTLLGARYHVVQPERYAANGWKPAWRVIYRGHGAAKLMRDLRPLMGRRRQEQIDAALARYQGPRPLLISDEDARELARRYWAGDRRPTALGREYGIQKNAAIYYIKKYSPSMLVR